MNEKRYYFISDADRELAESRGISYKAVYNRVHSLGWDVDRAITEPVGSRKRTDAEYAKLAESNGIKITTFRNRVYAGWSQEKAATKPVSKSGPDRKYLTDEQIEIANGNGIRSDLAVYRYKAGWSVEEAITVPVMNRQDAVKYGIERRKEREGRVKHE